MSTEVNSREVATQTLSRAAWLGRWKWVIVAVILVAFVGLGSEVHSERRSPRCRRGRLRPRQVRRRQLRHREVGGRGESGRRGHVGDALTSDAAAATDSYSQPSSGGPVFSITFTGVAGTGTSGIYPITISGLDSNLLVRVQTGPAINGTELRDATDKFPFGDFTNQIAYQDAAVRAEQ